MKQSEVKELSTDELQIKLKELKTQQLNLKFEHSVSPLESPMQLKVIRKSIARIATELTKRELQ